MNQYSCIVQSVNALLTFSKVDLTCTVFCNKVFVLFPVVLIHVECESCLFLNSHNCGKLEEMPFILVRRRFSDTDEAASIIDKFLNCGNNDFVCPILAAGVCGVCVSHI